MVAYYFDQVTYVWEESNNFQELKIDIYEFRWIVGSTVFLRYKEKTKHFFNLQFLLLLRGLSPLVA